MSQEEDGILVTFYTDDYANQQDFVRDEKALIKELIVQSGQTIQDVTLDYLQGKFTNQIQLALEKVVQQKISPAILKGLLGLKNLKLVLEAEHINTLHAENLYLERVQDAQFYIDRLATMENDPAFQLTEKQFQTLTKQLSNVLEKGKIEEIKNLLTEIQDGLAKQDSLGHFLADNGISIANNLASSILFLIMDHWLMR